MAFTDVEINDILSRISSYALRTGRFDQVNGVEPKNAPSTTGMTCSIWVQAIETVTSSGLSATSGVFILNLRIYTSFSQQPFDMIDPQMTSATADIMNMMNGEFELGGADDVRAIDVLGMSGTALSAKAGYVEIDRRLYRVMTIVIPIIINDMWAQTP
jgi:hypothetical protein